MEKKILTPSGVSHTVVHEDYLKSFPANELEKMVKDNKAEKKLIVIKNN